ncbi:hypothetical protein [Succinivibrio sp.]|uniref:hypothetical protein n=1 Tax=Succinivibrio sp. TaxID=2053619 RepID=UPI0025E82CAB|nr:hypothetical protein [Succinivibrio sp.]MBQ9220424.1 hypothetical protein [Succinivibrio sp.]
MIIASSELQRILKKYPNEDLNYRIEVCDNKKQLPESEMILEEAEKLLKDYDNPKTDFGALLQTSLELRKKSRNFKNVYTKAEHNEICKEVITEYNNLKKLVACLKNAK